MTEKDAKEILRREYYRVVDRLGEVDPVTSPALYRELLEIADRLHWQSEGAALTPVASVEEIMEETKADPIPEVEEPELVPEIEPLAIDAAQLSKEVVRAALANSRRKGVDVTELLQGMGYDNFTAVPASKYAEIMEKLEKH